MKLLGRKLSIEYSEANEALFITTPELESSRAVPIQVRLLTLKGMSFKQAAEFVGERVLLNIPDMRKLFAEYLWQGREPPMKVSSAESPVAALMSVQALISGVTQAGNPISIELGIGQPYCLSEGRWRCDISMQPLYPSLPAVPGRDAFQASCFAHYQLLDLLRLFVEKGGKLFNTDGSIFDLNYYAAVDPHNGGKA